MGIHWLLLSPSSHYIPLSFFVTILIQYTSFFVAYRYQIDLLTDFVGSTNIILCVVIPLILNNVYSWEQILITVLVASCRLWLALFLLTRVWQRGKDARFDEIRGNALHFFGFWTLQVIWVFVVSFGAAFVAGESEVHRQLEALHLFGLAIYIVGFALQVVADVQKFRFRSLAANSTRVCKIGVWRYSRHPNYMGEILVWLGILLVCLPVIRNSPDKWGWCAIGSPLLTAFLLLFVSGINIAELRHYEASIKDDMRR